MNQPTQNPRRATAGIPIPSPTFAPVLSPPDAGIGIGVVDADIGAGVVDSVTVALVELVVIVVELLSLEGGLATSLFVMLK